MTWHVDTRGLGPPDQQPLHAGPPGGGRPWGARGSPAAPLPDARPPPQRCGDSGDLEVWKMGLPRNRCARKG